MKKLIAALTIFAASCSIAPAMETYNGKTLPVNISDSIKNEFSHECVNFVTNVVPIFGYEQVKIRIDEDTNFYEFTYEDYSFVCKGNNFILNGKNINFSKNFN